MRGIHVPALSETSVEVKSDQPLEHTTAAAVEANIHTGDDESTDPLPSGWEHGMLARTACSWIASDCFATVQPTHIDTHGL